MNKYKKSKSKKKELIGKTAACCLTVSLVTGAFAVYADAISFEKETPVAGMSLTLNNYYIKNEGRMNSQIVGLNNPIVGTSGDDIATLIVERESQTEEETQTTEEIQTSLEETTSNEEGTIGETESSEGESESQSETINETESTSAQLDQIPDTISETEAPTEAETSIYDTIAVSRCFDYVNVRSIPSTDGEILGKIYDGCAATILETEGDWYKIESGSVKGYIKAEYFVTGSEAEALAEQLADKIATVNTTTLRVRAAADIEADCVTLVPLGEEFMIMEEENGWAKIEIDESTNGWVSMEFLDIRVEFDTAISIEEEQAKIAEQEAAKERAEEARRRAEEEAEAAKRRAEEARRRAEEEESRKAAQATTTVAETTTAETTVPETEEVETSQIIETQPETEAVTEPVTEPETTTQPETEAQTQAPEVSDNDANAALRDAIVAYALQFEGNPYVYGGNSLTTGTDCSGFVKLIYQEFGYNLTRRASLQYNEGRRISVDELKPGDLIFYGSGEVDHVTMYIGNGKVIHASTARTGIKISSMNYRSIYGAVSIID